MPGVFFREFRERRAGRKVKVNSNCLSRITRKRPDHSDCSVGILISEWPSQAACGGMHCLLPRWIPGWAGFFFVAAGPDAMRFNCVRARRRCQWKPQRAQRARRSTHTSPSVTLAVLRVLRVLRGKSAVGCRPDNDPPPGRRCRPGSSKKLVPSNSPESKDGCILVVPAERATWNPTATRSNPSNPAPSG
jgi:hypothetical protein